MRSIIKYNKTLYNNKYHFIGKACEFEIYMRYISIFFNPFSHIFPYMLKFLWKEILRKDY